MNEPIEVIDVEHISEYVIGLPMYIAVTVRAHPNISSGGLFFADIIDLNQCIGIEMEHSSGDINSCNPKPVSGRAEDGKPFENLAAGDLRRMLTDISPLIGNQTEEGRYRVRFSYQTIGDSYRSNDLRIKFRNPTPEEAGIINTLAPDRSSYTSWADWTISEPAQSMGSREIGVNNPIKFSWILRNLFYGNKSLEDVSPTILDRLPDLFKPESNLLKAELYQARKDEQSYKRLTNSVLTETPGLKWWIAMLEEDGAYLQSVRMDPVEDNVLKIGES